MAESGGKLRRAPVTESDPVRPDYLSGKRDFRRLYSANYEAESGEFLPQLTNYGAQSREFSSLEGKINPGISNFGHLPPHLALSGVLPCPSERPSMVPALETAHAART